MPILLELVERLKLENFCFPENVMLFGVQHIMDQTLALCWALNELGISYDRIALCGKAYSYCPPVANELSALGVLIKPQHAYSFRSSQAKDLVDDIRELATDFSVRKASLINPTVLILDDGGHALTNLIDMLLPPFHAAGIEQTASGYWQTGIRSVSIPVVDVGSSAVKRLCEPPMIVDTALKFIRHRTGNNGRRLRIGIVGLGYIGLALSDEFRQLGGELSVFDRRTDAYYRLHSSRARRVHEVFDRSDIIFGCTGVDITRGLEAEVGEFGLMPKSRELMSLSSGDDEFFTIKSQLVDKAFFEDSTYIPGSIPDISGELFGSTFTIANNGFPINFDNSRESAPLELIQGTMSALVAGICQAYKTLQEGLYFGPRADRITLDLDFQSWLLRRWSKALPFQPRFRGRRISPTPRQSVLVKLSSLRTNPPSVTGPPTFGQWTKEE